MVRPYSAAKDVKVWGSRNGPVIALFSYTRNFIPCHLFPPRCINGQGQILPGWGCGVTLASCSPRGQKTFPVSVCDGNRLCSSCLGPVARSCTALKFCFLVCHGMISSIQTLRRFSTVSQAKAGSPGPLEINRPS